ncbi:metallopeptidase Oma1 [Schizosaccharomyces pombe]|uniref:Mitochondrial metalloendopeptidase OMA1 n=1 Tax=Schizosaccharomyces pombe (strain 972 / ATCC 24843) TaxID=284812 RepID=OMA1_SCHPO|nr:putative metallopeptidase Oma1 [Schizosaccharomyces pombe]Q9P7G4.1 RecName: Full=Mitochondrial metalloendopeptidase OMA1 [Schizosaccharomyces pombe 972h-]CAB77005.1 metallopeptidase Oma1 (predicted) [Schizosaccharomyces pombe]|eukprot:NP_593540.1 putative metallopeptidase Oma1 [Schizosaccharomyces pombe]
MFLNKYISNYSRTRAVSCAPVLSYKKCSYRNFNGLLQARFQSNNLSWSNRNRVVYKSFQPNPRDKRFQWIFGALIAGGGVYYFTHLEYVPISNRRRFNDVSLDFEKRMAQDAYKEVMSEYGDRMLPSYHPTTLYVSRVLKRIIAVSGMSDLKWELHVIRDPTPNAFVLPGGKVFVFEGILPMCKGEDGLAAVLAHETAHQVARHSAEKIAFTRAVSCIVFLAAASLDLSGQLSHFLLNFGLLLPFSRKMETEADYIGLMLMSQACFDPNAAKTLWERMDAAEGQMGKALAFASTHPSSKKRIRKIEEWLPEAQVKRETSDCYHETWPMLQSFKEVHW